MKNPRFDYDEDADVMYISFGEPKPCGSEGDIPGVVIRYTADGELNGITIIDYSKRTNRGE